MMCISVEVEVDNTISGATHLAKAAAKRTLPITKGISGPKSRVGKLPRTNYGGYKGKGSVASVSQRIATAI